MTGEYGLQTDDLTRRRSERQKLLLVEKKKTLLCTSTDKFCTFNKSRFEKIGKDMAATAWRIFTRSVSGKKIDGDRVNVEDVLKVLRDGSEVDRREAAEFIRDQCREDLEVRKLVIEHGGLLLLAELARSTDTMTVEFSVTALHNLSLSNNLQGAMILPEVIEALIHVLREGTDSGKANAAATLFYLTRDLQLAEKVAKFSGIYAPLVELLKGNYLRGQKDASYAMCHLTLTSEGRSKLVAARVIEALLDLLENGNEEMEDKAAAVISNIAKCEEGRRTLRDLSAVDVLADVLQSSKPRAQEDAAITLFLMANDSPEAREEITTAGLLPDLVALSKSDKISARGQQKVHE